MNFGEEDNMQPNIDDIVAQSRASQNKIELKKVLQFVGEIKPQVIVEIGVHKGYSMEVWKKAFNPEILIGIENNEKEIDPELNKELDIIIGDSHDDATFNLLKEQLHGKKVDFLFIDGDHTFAGVSRDYQLYQPLVREGGLIAFHDIMLDSNEWRMAGVDVHRFFFQNLVNREGSKYFTFWDEIGKGTGVGLYYNQ